MKNQIIEWLKIIVVALIIAFIITQFIGTTKVSGGSMNPTLSGNDFLVTYNTKNVSRADIIILKTDLKLKPEDIEGLNFIDRLKVGEYKTLIKRVVAVEGDSLRIENGKVILNGRELEEPYIAEGGTPGNINIEKIPRDNIFVMGDNRSNSLDSRAESLGLINKKYILGKVIIRLYPLSKIELVK